MPEVVCDITISLDGYAAGPNQSREDPLGQGGERLHRWMFEDAESNADEIAAITDAGANVMGRNMFTAGRGDWDESWTGWWGEDPPYHGPVYVLTHYPRQSVEMAGGTTFHFVTDGIESALAQAREAAGDRNVAIAGGAETVRQYLNIGAIDVLRLQVVPIVLGAGERLLAGVGDIELEPVSARATRLATHLTYRRAG